MRRHLIAAAATLLTLPAVAQAEIFAGFAPAQTYLVGDNPREVRVADFNGDGALDIVTCNADSDDIAVLIGNGDTTFGPPTFYLAGNTPLSISAGDFDSDGDIDFTVANGNGVSISIFFGNADGTFAEQPPYAWDPNNDPPYPGVLMTHTMADFDGDGDSDIAVVSLTGTAVMLLPNDGNGVFGPHVVIDEPPGPGFPAGMRTADFDGDGDMDLMLIRGYFLGQGGARMLLNDGDGSSWTAIEVPAEADGIVTNPADFNGDGILDIAFSRTINPDGYMLVGMGNGDGTFGPYTTYPVNRPYPPTTADLNGDGNVDLIVPSFGPYHTISVMLGNGDGTFEDPVPFAAGGNNPHHLVAVDIDFDGWLDIVSSNRGTDNVSIFINQTCTGDLDGDGAVGLEDLAVLLANYGATGVGYAEGDLDGDGDVDLADLAQMLSLYATPC